MLWCGDGGIIPPMIDVAALDTAVRARARPLTATFAASPLELLKSQHRFADVEE